MPILASPPPRHFAIWSPADYEIPVVLFKSELRDLIGAVVRRARPYRGENPEPGKDVQWVRNRRVRFQLADSG